MLLLLLLLLLLLGCIPCVCNGIEYCHLHSPHLGRIHGRNLSITIAMAGLTMQKWHLVQHIGIRSVGTTCIRSIHGIVQLAGGCGRVVLKLMLVVLVTGLGWVTLRGLDLVLHRVLRSHHAHSLHIEGLVHSRHHAAIMLLLLLHHGVGHHHGYHHHHLLFERKEKK